MTAPQIVTCARCRKDWPEDSDEVTYRHGDWWCTDQTACDERMHPKENTP